MSGLKSVMTGLVCGTLLLASIGCNENKEKPTNVPDQALIDAQNRIRDLEAALQQARAQAAQGTAAQGEINRLTNELNKAREQLAKRAEPKSPAPGWESVPGGAMISIEGTILFDSGKAVLKPSGRKTLDEVAHAINEKFPNADIYVFGHTDNVPIRYSGWKDNYQLSCERALSVVRYLIGQNVDNNLAACGWGDRRPIADNATAQARQANRRVQIFAMAPQPALSGATGGSPPSPAGRVP